MLNVVRIHRIPEYDNRENIHKDILENLPSVEEIRYDLSHYISEIKSSDNNDPILGTAFINSENRLRYRSWNSKGWKPDSLFYSMLTLLVFPLYEEALEYVIKRGDFWINSGTDPIKIKRNHRTIDHKIIRIKRRLPIERCGWSESDIKFYALFSQNPFNNIDKYEFGRLFLDWQKS